MVATNYDWDPVFDCIDEELSDGGTAFEVYTQEPSPFGAVLSQTGGSTASYFHFDCIGSTRLLTATDQSTQSSFYYSAFGEPRATTGAVSTPFGFVGESGYYTNTISGTRSVRSRDYAPNTSRWISSDPIGFSSGDINSYRYVFNRPVLDIDPSGNAVQFGLLAFLIATACVGSCTGCVVNITDAHKTGPGIGKTFCTVVSCGSCAVCVLALCLRFYSTCVTVIIAGVVYLVIAAVATPAPPRRVISGRPRRPIGIY